jgi:hypothetical protein
MRFSARAALGAIASTNETMNRAAMILRSVTFPIQGGKRRGQLGSDYTAAALNGV